MKYHKFSVEVANLCGVNAAIIFDSIVYMVKNNSTIKNGKPYAFTTIPDLLFVYPYMNKNQIKTAIKRLIESGLVEDGGPVTVRYRRHRSYTLTHKGAQIYLDY